jgi:hypothetical protein
VDLPDVFVPDAEELIQLLVGEAALLIGKRHLID